MLLWASNTTPDVWGEKFGKKRLMSEMENAFKQEKQPTSKKENSKNRKELWQSRWSGPTDIDWRTYVRLQFLSLHPHILWCFYIFFMISWPRDQPLTARWISITGWVLCRRAITGPDTFEVHKHLIVFLSWLIFLVY